MNPQDIFNFIKSILSWDVETSAAFFTGLLIGGVLVYLFTQRIQIKTQFATAAENHTPAAADPNVQPIFTKLVQELIRRDVIHESRRPATIRA